MDRLYQFTPKRDPYLLKGASSARALGNDYAVHPVTYTSLQYLNNLMNEIHSKEYSAAQEQMQFQRETNAMSMAYDATEAQKTRDWQQWMSDTAHQREVADLKAAGLNPILAVNSGAAVPSGATASSSSLAGAKANYDASLISSIASIIMNGETNAMQLEKERIASLASIQNAYTAAEASKVMAAISAEATKFAAVTSSDASRYSSDLSYKMTKLKSSTDKMIAFLNSFTQRRINSENIEYKENYPSNVFGAVVTGSKMLGKSGKKVYDDLSSTINKGLDRYSGKKTGEYGRSF